MLKKIGRALVKEVLKGPSTGIPPHVPTTFRNPVTDIFRSPHRKEETIFDLFKENVEPGVGALVYCELFTAEHSGIYLGNGWIAQLSGKGNIERVSPERFTDNITTTDRDIFIPVNRDGQPIYCYGAASNAEKMIGGSRSYHLLFDNCHQFSAGCITGDFENDNNFLWMVKTEFNEAVSETVKWQRWKWYKKK